MLKGEADFDIDPSGRNIWFGVREFAMAAAVNGMALHGGVIPYGATFFVFSDYLRPAVRLAALMGLPSIFVLTHDSIAVGEDGPTHEPVEHLMSFRAMPNVTVYRPADGKETIAAWKTAVQAKDKPTLLVLTRQGLPELEGTTTEGAEKGGYVIAGDVTKADTLLLGTGSEVHLLVEAQKNLVNQQLSFRFHHGKYSKHSQQSTKNQFFRNTSRNVSRSKQALRSVGTNM